MSVSERWLPVNEHLVDRVVRVVAGVAILSLTVIGPKSLWGLVGLAPIATGLLGSCPLYTVFGISTCPMKK